MAGLKIDMPRTNDIDERFYSRILCIEALNRIIDDMYGYFVNEAYERKWQTEGYNKFQKWLHEK